MSKFNPPAPKISGTLSNTSARKSADHDAKYSGLRKDQKIKAREENRKAKIELEYRRIKTELEGFRPLFELLSEDQYNKILRNSCATFYDDQIILPLSSSSAKGSKKFQLLLTIMGLISVANSVGSDSRFDSEDTFVMFNKFAQSLSDTATATKKTFEEVVESGMEYYSNFSLEKTVGPVVESIARHFVVPVLVAKSKGRDAGISDFAASAVSSVTLSATSLEAKKVDNKKEVSTEEVNSFAKAVSA